jgi:flagellar motor component MotA
MEMTTIIGIVIAVVIMLVGLRMILENQNQLSLH